MRMGRKTSTRVCLPVSAATFWKWWWFVWNRLEGLRFKYTLQVKLHAQPVVEGNSVQRLIWKCQNKQNTEQSLFRWRRHWPTLDQGGAARLWDSPRGREPDTGPVQLLLPALRSLWPGHFHRENVSDASVPGHVSVMRLSLSPFLS